MSAWERSIRCARHGPTAVGLDGPPVARARRLPVRPPRGVDTAGGVWPAPRAGHSGGRRAIALLGRAGRERPRRCVDRCRGHQRCDTRLVHRTTAAAPRWPARGDNRSFLAHLFPQTATAVLARLSAEETMTTHRLSRPLVARCESSGRSLAPLTPVGSARGRGRRPGACHRGHLDAQASRRSRPRLIRFSDAAPGPAASAASGSSRSTASQSC